MSSWRRENNNLEFIIEGGIICEDFVISYGVIIGAVACRMITRNNSRFFSSMMKDANLGRFADTAMSKIQARRASSIPARAKKACLPVQADMIPLIPMELLGYRHRLIRRSPT